MIDKNVVRNLVEEWLKDKEYFLVDVEISQDSKVKIFVIPTDEEFMIASDVERIVNGK